MTATGRLLDLLGLLQLGRPWTGGELARRLSTTPRTVRRDVDRLRQLGYRIDAFAGPGGGYQLAGGSRIPPLLLDADEVLAIGVALTGRRDHTYAGFDEHATSALAKLDTLLPEHLTRQLRALAATAVHTHESDAVTDPHVITLLADAALHRRIVRFEHRHGATGEQRTRRVEPYQLVRSWRHWYLAGFDLDRDDWRTFRLDRITGAVDTGHTAAPRRRPPGPLISQPEQPCHARVELHDDVEQAWRYIPRSVGTLTATGAGRCLLDVSGGSWDEIAWHLCGVPARFEVVAPDDLALAVARRVRALAEQHLHDGR